MEFIGFVKDYIEIVIFLSGTLTGLSAYFIKWRVERKKSSALLYDQLEKMKRNLIEKISKEIEDADEIAKQQKLLNELKSHCTDCYNEVIKKLGYADSN